MTVIGSLLAVCALLGGQAQERQALRTLSVTDAKGLVRAALTAQQRRLPRLEMIQEGKTDPRYLFFMVVWQGTAEGSVVVGHYAVDPRTGDVWNAVMECAEETNKTLRDLQAKLRARLELSPSEYKRLKSKGPLCEQ